MSAVKAEQQEIDNAATLIGMSNNDDQYLTFILDNEEYGIDILRVQEIKGWTPVTRIPNAPDYLRGVLNLRGTIVPIIEKVFPLEEVVEAMLEPALARLAAGEAVQFERLGYFSPDARDDSADARVFNRIVTLRDSWAKIEKQAMQGQN